MAELQISELAQINAEYSVRISSATRPWFGAKGDSWYAVRHDVEAAFQEAGFGPESDGTLRTSELVGRKPLFELETSRGTFIVRRFSHGGLWRFATGRRFRDPSRPFREILASQHLARAGIATAEIAAGRARRVGIAGWELDIVTRRVENTLDLGDLLGRARRGEARRANIGLCCAALGILVQRLHAVGFLHADLTPNNVLVNASVLDGAEPELTVLDLDRARIVPRASDRDRRDNLRRLYRFVARREERDGRALSRTDYARFFKGYDQGGTTWKADWRAVLGAHAQNSAFHRIGWFFEESLGKKRDVRERS